MKQIDSQSDLTSISSFARPSYLTVRSSVCVTSIWDPCIFNCYNLCQTGSSYLRRKPHQCALRFNEQITRTHFLLLQRSIRPVPTQVILLWKGPPKLCIEYYLVPLLAFPPKSPGYGFEMQVCRKVNASTTKISELLRSWIPNFLADLFLINGYDQCQSTGCSFFLTVFYRLKRALIKQNFWNLLNLVTISWKFLVIQINLSGTFSSQS